MSKKKKTSPKHFYYLDIGPYPMVCIFAPNERAYTRAIKKSGIKNDTGYPEFSGCVSYFPASDCTSLGNSSLCIITIDLSLDVSLAQESGLAAHEAQHVLQRLVSVINESAPGWEFEAYTVQAIVQGIVSATQDYRKECKK